MYLKGANQKYECSLKFQTGNGQRDKNRHNTVAQPHLPPLHFISRMKKSRLKSICEM